jgi:radical SAM superfamily enzyme YgiQ (UPF0313 family)
VRARGYESQCDLGPIRPPSEALSLLIRVTRNCPWNNCLFCPVYKGTKFARRTEEEVLAEIDLLADAASCLRERLGIDRSQTSISGRECLRIVHDHTCTYEERRIALWLHRGGNNVFLQDADSLIMPAPRVAGILKHLRSRFPEINRVTTYARSRTLFAKTDAQLADLKEAGLTRIHVGLESGSDEVLAFVKKGCRAEHHVVGIKKAAEAGFDICCYVMPGLGGKEFSEVHARDTARVLREINPTHVRLRSMFLNDGIPLYEKVRSGEMTLLEEHEQVSEIRDLVRDLKGVNGRVASDHDHNLLMDVEGHLTDDAEFLEHKLSRFLDLPRDTRDSFIVARRAGHLRSFDAFLSDPEHGTRFMPLVEELRDLGGGSLLAGMSKRFVLRLF